MSEAKAIWENRFLENKLFSYGTEWLDPHIDRLMRDEAVKILEIGCGDGACALKLESGGFEVHASDISEIAVERLSAKSTHMRVRCFDMGKGIPYEDDSFDAVVSNLSSHYFSARETEFVYGEVYRVLRSGGRFILRVNDLREYHINKVQDTVQLIEPDYVLSKNGKQKRYFSAVSLRDSLRRFDVSEVKEVEFPCNGRVKYALEATAFTKGEKDA